MSIITVFWLLFGLGWALADALHNSRTNNAPHPVVRSMVFVVIVLAWPAFVGLLVGSYLVSRMQE